MIRGGAAEASAGEVFDVVYLADTLEITNDPDRVIEEAARVLKPGGVLIYDTVNRTLLSRLIYLGAFQAVPSDRSPPSPCSDALAQPALDILGYYVHSGYNVTRMLRGSHEHEQRATPA
jgi:ubiquinone/menaquinone biosynthesis C-methylase UbiE